jgi:hypothetical protein
MWRAHSTIVCLTVGLMMMTTRVSGATDASGLLVADLDDLYAKRAHPEALRALGALTARALREYPGWYDVEWRAARYWVWMGDIATSDDARRDAGKTAWTYGEAACHRAAGHVEAPFYTAVGIGLYAQAVGILTAIMQGLEGKFLQYIDAAIALDPRYSHGGPPLAKGRFYYLLPWPKRDLERAERYLRDALATNPEALRAHLYLSDVLKAKGNKAAARHAVSAALNGDFTYDPAEAGLIKDWARVADRSW